MDAEEWLEKGITLKDDGQSDEAFESFEQAIAIDPTLALAWERRGSTLYELGRLEDALASYCN
jgi:tetratricopeptide (TPR) repeat protein